MNKIKIKISEIKPNQSNPRTIKDDNFKKLLKSIKEFPEMLDLRPIVVNKDMTILGGNMRYKACIEAGIKEVPVIIADNLTEDQEREFLIKDNVSGGEWDWDILANEWDSEELVDWGLDVWQQGTDTDYSDKNGEVDTNFDGQKYKFTLEYSENEYTELKERLNQMGQSPESIFYDAIIK